MEQPERFKDLPDYPFPRLRRLLADTPAGGEVVDMSIGEPRHGFPEWVGPTIAEHAAEFGNYPPNEGTPELRRACADWLGRRYGVTLDPETQLMALNGTREGLFNAAVALCPETKNGQRPAVLIPNPFYQVYAVGALAIGAEPIYVPATRETGFLPDYASVPADLLDRTALVFTCSPSNPQGAVATRGWWADLLQLADRHDFRILADECYSEIWRLAPPPGALEAVAAAGADPERVVVFHSLSKRSNLPGLRSGFAAGGIATMAAMKELRAFAGAPLPLPLQRVAALLWADDNHAEASRQRYLAKYRIAEEVLGRVPGFALPEAGFFLWLPVDDSEKAALKLWHRTGVRALPGAYLGRRVGDLNPGHGYLRVALVTDENTTRAGLTRLRDCLYN